MAASVKFAAFFLCVVALSNNVSALDFHYRFYDNGGCDHSSPVSDTFPLNSLPPLSGSSGNCLSAPTGINWNALEVDNSLSNGQFELITFCNINCGGADSGAQANTNCFAPVPGCAIGSFIIVPT